MIGKIIRNVSNLYIVQAGHKCYEGVARGRLKTEEIKPVVGDNVEFDFTDEGKIVIFKILDRQSFLKRPKVSNVSQVIFVICPLAPSPNFLVLDKELCYAKFLGIKAVIAINKTDLSEKKANEIFELYSNAGYKVLNLEAECGKGIEDLKVVLHGNTSVLAGQSGVR